jgi:hypothetical protein
MRRDIATGRPGSTRCCWSFFTAPYAVSPPHASGASWSLRLSGILTSDGAHTHKYSANVPMIGLLCLQWRG